MTQGIRTSCCRSDPFNEFPGNECIYVYTDVLWQTRPAEVTECKGTNNFKHKEAHKKFVIDLLPAVEAQGILIVIGIMYVDSFL